MKQISLGTCIRTLRIRGQMTQAALADRLGVTDKAVSKWERGVSYPDIALFPALADALGVTVNDLLKDYMEEYRPSRLTQIFEMSHDIRTPLHIILGSVELAKTSYQDTDMLLHYLESIRVSGEYLLKAFEHIIEVTDQGRKAAPENGENTLEDLRDYLETQMEKTQEQAAEEDFDFSGKRILVAEDIELNREIAGEILRRTGAETEFAPDGKACLEMVEAAPAGYYHMILMDIMMPVMDGIEATERIRRLADPQKASIPIIAMTANVYEKDKNAALAAGMDEFLEKPVMPGHLFSMMKRYLIKMRGTKQ